MRITLVGNPIALARPRFCKSDNSVYDSQKAQKVLTRNYLLSYLLKSESKVQSEFERCRYHVKLNFRFYRPPSLRGKTDEELIKMPHVIKPDLDNLVKYILDCGNGILWYDDSQIFKIHAEKTYSNGPRTEIEVNRIYEI